MGKIIEARFEEIVPGNIGILPRKIKNVADRVRSGKILFPIPVRRSEFYADKYTSLEIGNSRIIYSMMSGISEVPVFLAESKEDFISPEMFLETHEYSLLNANRSIANRWDLCEETARTSGFESYAEYFKKLVQKYPQFRNVSDFLKYYRSLNADFDNPFRIGTLKDLV
jgi:hypothetical protein